jgi:hypothetical protein
MAIGGGRARANLRPRGAQPVEAEVELEQAAVGDERVADVYDAGLAEAVVRQVEVKHLDAVRVRVEQSERIEVLTLDCGVRTNTRPCSAKSL